MKAFQDQANTDEYHKAAAPLILGSNTCFYTLFFAFTCDFGSVAPTPRFTF